MGSDVIDLLAQRGALVAAQAEVWNKLLKVEQLIQEATHESFLFPKDERVLVYSGDGFGPPLSGTYRGARYTEEGLWHFFCLEYPTAHAEGTEELIWSTPPGSELFLKREPVLRLNLEAQ